MFVRLRTDYEIQYEEYFETVKIGGDRFQCDIFQIARNVEYLISWERAFQQRKVIDIYLERKFVCCTCGVRAYSQHRLWPYLIILLERSYDRPTFESRYNSWRNSVG